MGLFSRKSEPSPAATPAPAEEHRLVNPGLPGTHPRQVGYEVLSGTGLGLAVWGAGDVADCFRALAASSPVFLQTEAVGAGFGSLRQDAGVWMAWSSPSGSAIVYCGSPESDSGFLLQHVTQPVMSLRGPFAGSLIHLGSSSEAGLVEIIDTGDLVPVWDLPGLENGRPAPLPVSAGYQALAAAVREELVGHGGTELEGGMVKVVVGTGDGRSQLVFVALHPRIQLLSPIARTVDGAVPPTLRSLDPGGYEVDVVADLVVLTESVPDQVPTVMTADGVVARLIALARYADTVEASVSGEDDL